MTEFTPVIQRTCLQPAIICDIDGTLAHMNWRSPYDYSKVSEDTVDEMIREICNMFYKSNYWVVIVSWRPDSCFDDTAKWLEDNGVLHSTLIMRKEWDKRNDAIVKREILEDIIEEDYYIEFVLDDRSRVVKMWRESGIKCLQVAEWNF